MLLVAILFGLFSSLRKLYADGGYRGRVFQKALKRVLRQVDLEIVIGKWDEDICNKRLKR